jgi:hypothetical protein
VGKAAVFGHLSSVLFRKLLAPCSMRYAKPHRPIASLWRARLSIDFMRE